jgi:hypothetical protein
MLYEYFESVYVLMTCSLSSCKAFVRTFNPACYEVVPDGRGLHSMIVCEFLAL